MKIRTAIINVGTPALLITGLLGSAVASPASASASQTITVISNGGTNSVWIKDVIPAFEKKYPDIKVTQDAFDPTTLSNTATQVYASSSAPDVGFIQTTFPGYPILIKQGALTNVSNVWASSGLKGAVTKSTLADWTVNGSQYAIAADQVWTPVIYYNKALFKKAGIAPKKHRWYRRPNGQPSSRSSRQLGSSRSPWGEPIPGISCDCGVATVTEYSGAILALPERGCARVEGHTAVFERAVPSDIEDDSRLEQDGRLRQWDRGHDRYPGPESIRDRRYGDVVRRLVGRR